MEGLGVPQLSEHPKGGSFLRGGLFFSGSYLQLSPRGGWMGGNMERALCLIAGNLWFLYGPSL